MKEYTSPDAWFGNKFNLGMPFPNMPYWFDGELKLAETVAVHQYLAAKYRPELLGRDAKERGIARMIENVTRSDFNQKITGLMYGQDDP